MPATTTRRVEDNTASHVNEAIHHQTDVRLAYFEKHPDEIDRRLDELDHEWNIERSLATNSAILSLAGLALSIARGRGWILLPLAVQGFYLQHALTGWCPPLPIMRRLRIRTPREIAEERRMLLQLRDRAKQP